MRIMMIAAFLITFPAVAALVYALMNGNTYLLIAAAASLALNSLPFLVAGFFMHRQGGGADLEH